MGKIKICMLTTSYPTPEDGARGIFIEKLVTNLRNSREVSVEVISPNPKYKNILASGGIVSNIKSNFKAKLEFIPCILDFFFRAIKESKNCDIIHANWIFSGIPGLIAKKLYKKPLMISIRGGELKATKKSKLINKLWCYILKRTDIIVCVSNEIKEELNNFIKIDTQILLNGIDYNIFKPINKTNARKELGLNEKKTILIYVGRLTREKGPFMLLDAFKKINDKNLLLLFIGEDNSKTELIKQSQKAGLEDRVFFLGNVEHKLLPKYLNASDIFVFPRFFEAGGNTLLEAASCGLPIIGTEEGFVKDILKYKGVYLIKKETNSLRDAIIKLSMNKNLREKLGREARNTILKYGIGWKQNSQKYIRLYKILMKKN